MVVQMKKPLLPKHVRLSTSDLTSHLGPRLQAALAAAHDAALAHDSDALKQVRSSKAAAVAPSTLHLSPPLTLTTLTTHHSGGVRRPCCRVVHGSELPPDGPRPAAFRRAHSARQHPPRAAAGRRASGRAASARAGRGDGQPHPTETALRAALAAALGATSWGRERQRRRQGEWWWWRWWGGCGSSAGQEAKAAEPQQRLRDRLCGSIATVWRRQGAATAHALAGECPPPPSTLHPLHPHHPPLTTLPPLTSPSTLHPRSLPTTPTRSSRSCPPRPITASTRW